MSKYLLTRNWYWNVLAVMGQEIVVQVISTLLSVFQWITPWAKPRKSTASQILQLWLQKFIALEEMVALHVSTWLTSVIFGHGVWNLWVNFNKLKYWEILSNCIAYAKIEQLYWHLVNSPIRAAHVGLEQFRRRSKLWLGI